MAGDDRLEFRILGPFEVSERGKPVEVGAGKQRALLALLLLHAGEVVSTDRLIDALWGERPPASALNSVHVYVSQLRKALGNGRLATRGHGYELALEPEQLDLGRFERLLSDGRQLLAKGEAERAAEALRAGLALWRGPPLWDFASEPFAQGEIARLEALRLAGVEERIETDLALGRHAELVPELEALIREHPLRERLRAQLMLALYRSGRQAEALDAYRQARRMLAEELGLEPGRTLQELERAILRQDTQLDSPSQAITPLRRARRKGGLLIAVGGALLLGAAIAIPIAALRGGDGAALASAGPNALAAIDPKTSRLVADIPVPNAPAGIAVDGASVWVVVPEDHAVSRIDAERGLVVQTTPVGQGPSGIAVSGESVWVVNSLGATISRISTETNQEVQTIPVGNGARDVAVGERSLWVTNVHDRTVSRRDPRTGRELAEIPMPAPPTDIVVAGGAVWVTHEAESSVSRLDPGRNTVVETIPVGNGPSGIAAGASSVWVANRLDATVSRIDLATNTVSAAIPVGGEPSDVALAKGFVWVADEYTSTISRIDPSSNAVTRTIPVGNGPVALAAAGDRLWLSVRSTRSEHRGGTLRIVTPAEPETFDPALAIRFDTYRFLHLTGDGLTGLRQVGGNDGNTLVPDLAVALPRPTDNGRTYTFRLRRGIRYSSGQPVRARDFRPALERAFRVRSPDAELFKAVIGTSACTARPGRCSLARGVVADHAAATVTFHLSDPDPEFLYKLAQPAAFPVPPGTPMTDVGMSRTIPGTGPYMIAGPPYWDGERLQLVRNGHFREWSRAAKPQGYPDEIVLLRRKQPLTDVEQGHADAMLLPPPGNRLDELAGRYPRQLHPNAPLQVLYMVLNTRVPPFNRVDVRRAVNYAVDRERAVALAGGPLAAQPICQLQRPNFPGYEKYCRYTLRPAKDGTWRGPDLTKARRLVAQSGTAGMHIVVWAPTFAPLDALSRQAASLLRTLGYRVSLRLRGNDYFPTIFDPNQGVQIAASGIGARYPAASTLLRGLRCSEKPPTNEAQFCDPRIDAEIDRALALQTTEPNAANALWAKIDRAIADHAPYLFLVATNWPDFVSKRVGNYQFHPILGMLWSQAWVR